MENLTKGPKTLEPMMRAGKNSSLRKRGQQRTEWKHNSETFNDFASENLLFGSKSNGPVVGQRDTATTKLYGIPHLYDKGHILDGVDEFQEDKVRVKEFLRSNFFFFKLLFCDMKMGDQAILGVTGCSNPAKIDPIYYVHFGG